MAQRFPIAATPDTTELAAARHLFSQNSSFVKGVVDIAGLPAAGPVEICFAGRSNVGKSSLINALVGQKNLARSSNTPGRTQEINFFTLADTHYLVDLPGYGYAKAPVKVVEKWQRLLKAYLSGRAALRRAFLLIDARHGPKPVDEEIMDLLDKCAVNFQTVLTKSDKLKSGDLEDAVNKTRLVLVKHPAAYPEIILTSAEKGQGVDVLQSAIARID